MAHAGFRLVPTTMTLNGLERRSSPYCAIALQAHYVRVVENRNIMSVKYCLSPSSSLPLLAKANATCSARVSL